MSSIGRSEATELAARDYDQAKFDYDQVATERDCRLLNSGFYELSVERSVGCDDQILAQNRAMYRRRYTMLEQFATTLEVEFAVQRGRRVGNCKGSVGRGSTSPNSTIFKLGVMSAHA